MATMSTGLKQALLGTDDFKTAMDGGYIHIYAFAGSSDIPNPDAIVDTGSDYLLLATISASGGTSTTGCNFDAPVAGVISKAAAQTWDNSTSNNLASGTAAFFVHHATEHDGDAIVASTTEKRIVGSVGLVGADMNLQSLSLTSGGTQAISYYNLTLGVG